MLTVVSHPSAMFSNVPFVFQGNLCEANSRCNAHEGRISGMVLHRNVLYTVGYDGCLKVCSGELCSQNCDKFQTCWMP